MNRTLLLTASLALSFAVACGGKNKKEETAPDLGGATEETTEPDTSANTETAAPEANPELQQVVYFEFDAANLDDAARKKLDENYEWLKADMTRSLTIEGHTDEVGTAEYNLGLGERRASATRDYLVRLGIDEKRIKIITYGEERPAGTDDSANRRSMFVATKK